MTDTLLASETETATTTQSVPAGTKRTNLLENGLIWFGAGLSVAEILTGTYFAPLGFTNGLLAILLGHLIGCTFLFLAGYIGGKTRKSAMNTTKISFGSKGAWLFAGLNVLQLLGWTSIMIYDAALAANGIFALGNWAWALIIGAFIALWIGIGVTRLGPVNIVAMAGLFILTVILSVGVFSGGIPVGVSPEAMSFGAALELSISMPLSWLPLISDYTREAARPVAATAVSTVVYGLVSMWMYVIGLAAAIFAGTSDIAQMMLKAGLGVAALLIIVFSTVTTTFLDAWSAGISSVAIVPKLNGKYVALGATALGTAAAMAFNMDNITPFLYLIGSVFAPMIAILIVDFFILKRDYSKQSFDWVNLLIWVAGFIIYRLLMNVDFILGNTLPDMVITMGIAILIGQLRERLGDSAKKAMPEREETTALSSEAVS